MNIFIIGVLLISSALANITVYQCVHDGELCMTKTCCEVIEKESECCSDDDCDELSYQNVCCDEVQISHSFVFNDNLSSKNLLIKSTTDYPGILELSLESKSVILTQIIRGPPRPSEIVHPPKQSIFITNCSFLC